MLLPHTNSQTSYWFYDPEVLDITGQVPVRVFLMSKFIFPNWEIGTLFTFA